MNCVLKSHYYLGLDLGRQRDFSALAIISSRHIQTDRRNFVTYEWIREHHISLVHLERFPLATPYPDIVAHVRSLLHTPDLSHRSTLVIDSTGVGIAVVDLFRAFPLPARLCPVTITAGDHPSQSDGRWSIPRRHLFSALFQLIHTRRLALAANLALFDDLGAELSNLTLHTHPSGYQSLDPARSSQHDDLAIAVALAAFFTVETIPLPPKPQGPLPLHQLTVRPPKSHQS